MYEVLCKRSFSFTAEHMGDFTLRAALAHAETVFGQNKGSEVSIRSLNSGKIYLF